jgi:hypothetical protein
VSVSLSHLKHFKLTKSKEKTSLEEKVDDIEKNPPQTTHSDHLSSFQKIILDYFSIEKKLQSFLLTDINTIIFS